MSNTTVEKEIVQMEFDARKFKGGVQNAIRDISDLKKSFNMTEAMHSILSLQKGVEDAGDFSPMINGITKVSTQFNALGVVGWTVINKLTSGVIDFAKNLASAVAIEPLTSGFGEYSTQLNAVQTILANTKKHGSTLKDVNSALDELNEYADLTIYNFTEMTNAIGRFTTAGIDLETSVQAIKGLSNIAAISGANAEEAARAQYQLSQALAAGTIRLMDWRSIENANLGGEAFKDSLIETARIHGQNVDAMIKKNGSFQLSLQEGWLSAEIMLETLQKFTGELTDEDLLNLGYSEEQVKNIQEMAQTALDAAQDIKTVTQLWDVVQEAMGSGWAQTWRWIFGDFEAAKSLWTEVGNIITDFLGESSDARNHMLQVWSDIGGRDKLVEALFNLLEGGINIIRAFQEAMGDIFPPVTTLQLYRLTKGILAFSKRFKEGSENLNNFKSIVRGVFAVFDIFFRILKAVLIPIFALAKGVQLVDGGLWFLLGRVADAIVLWREWAIETGWFAKLSEHVVDLIKYLALQVKILAERFQSLDAVQKAVAWFRSIEITSEDLAKVWDALKIGLQAIIAPFYLAATGAQQLYLEIQKLKIVQDVAGWWNSIDWEATAEWFKQIGVNAKEMFEEFKSSDVMQSFLEYIDTFDGRRIKQFQQDAKDGFAWVDTLVNFLQPKLDALVNTLSGVPAKAKELAGKLLESLKSVFNYLTEDAENLDYSTLFEIINAGILGGILVAIRKIASGDFISGIIDDSDFGEGLLDMFDGLNSTLGSFQNNIRADTLQKIAISIAVLAGSIFLLTLIDKTKLQDSTAAIAIMVAALFGSAGVLGKVNNRSALQSAIAIIGLAIALNFMGSALVILSTIDQAEMERGLTAIGLSIIGLIATVEKIRTNTATLKSILAMQGMALALVALWGVIKLFGALKPEVLSQGLIGIAGALTIMSGAIAIIQKTSGKDKNSSLKAALAMLAIAKSMDKLFEAVLKFGLLDMEVLRQGLITVGLLLLGISLFSKGIRPGTLLQAAVSMLIMGAALLVIYEAVALFGKLDMYSIFVGIVTIAAVVIILALAANLMAGALPGALAMLVMAVAVTILAGALAILGQLSWESIAKGLVAVAGFLLLFVIAGYLLAPVVIVLLAFGAALLLIGAGAALFGLGIFLAATGLVALAGSGILIAQAIRVIGEAVGETLPELATGFALAVAEFLNTLAEKAPEMKESFKTLILTAVTAITEVTPDIVLAVVEMVSTLITGLLEAIVDLYPDIVQAGWDLLIEFLKGIEDNIQEAVDTALGIVENFIQGITDGLPDVITAAVELFFTFLETIEQEVATEENVQRMITIGADIAGNIISGIIKGLTDGVGRLVRKITGTVEESKEAWRRGWEEDSPSKFTYRSGTNLVLGFTNALRDGTKDVTDAFGLFVDNASEKLNPFIQALAKEVDENLAFSPVISPVLDLDGVTSQSGLIQDAFRRVVVPSELAYVGNVPHRDNESVGNIGEDRRYPGGVTYNQYNYSPSALSREAIYRQTNTQLAKLRNEVG